MIYYILVNISVIFLALLFYGFVSSAELSNKANLRNNKLFLIFVFLILVLFSGLRGDFTTDYKNYASLFYTYNSFSLTEILTANFYQEKGYVIFSRLIGEFTNSPVYLMLSTSAFIIYLFFKEIERDSKVVWLSVLLFVNIGAYYTSFNIMRHIMAVAIIFSGSKFLYNRQFIRFLIVVLLASFFHISAITMIPFYFILNAKSSRKNHILITTGSIIFTIFLEDFMTIIFKFGFQRYSNYYIGMTGLNLTSAVVPVAILLFVLIYNNVIHSEKETRKIIWYNATFYYAIFSVMGLRIQMMQRFAEYFAPYILLLIPFLIAKISDKKQRIIYFYIIIVLLISFNVITLSGTGYDPYYFIWNK